MFGEIVHQSHYVAYKKGCEMKLNKIDKIGKVFNLILGVIYLPLSFFSWLMMMASELTIDVTNSLYTALIDIFCFISFLIPFLCVASIILSFVLRQKGRSIFSFVIQFLPIAVFGFNLILLLFSDFINI